MNELFPKYKLGVLHICLHKKRKKDFILPLQATPMEFTIGQSSASDTESSSKEFLLLFKPLLTHPQVIQHLAYPLVVSWDVC